MARRAGAADSATDWVAQRRRDALSTFHDAGERELWRIDVSIESPIERAFAFALFSAPHDYEVIVHAFVAIRPYRIEYSEERARKGERALQIAHKEEPWDYPLQVNAADPLDVGSLVVWPQCHVGDARVDFLLEMRTADAASFLVVECDGHDFHEKTKEQARRDKARDRGLQVAGLPVFRFAGSDLYANAEGCVLECVDYLADAVDKIWRRRREGA